MTHTTLTTVLGVVQAIGTASLDYFLHSPMDGGAVGQPTFWVGMVIAAAMGVKGYYTQGTDPAK